MSRSDVFNYVMTKNFISNVVLMAPANPDANVNLFPFLFLFLIVFGIITLIKKKYNVFFFGCGSIIFVMGLYMFFQIPESNDITSALSTFDSQYVREVGYQKTFAYGSFL
jgi:hypothetical protein